MLSLCRRKAEEKGLTDRIGLIRADMTTFGLPRKDYALAYIALRSFAPGIQAVALEAWRYTYRTIFDPEFIEDFVRRNYAPEGTVSLLPRIHSSDLFFHVAEQDSNIVGFCNIGLTERSAQLLRIYLLPSHIGQGLGRKLLHLGEEFVMTHSLSSYFCFVHKDNELGKRFYLRNNFIHITEKDHQDEWYVEKVLSR
jgi:diamine N-acetyltransferase